MLENLKSKKYTLVDMQLISKINKRIHFLLYVIVIFSKYAWAFPLKDKKMYYNY